MGWGIHSGECFASTKGPTLMRWVIGYEGKYLVHRDGSVVDRRGHTMAVRIDRYGYKTVRISSDGKQSWKKVHRLVCEAFNGPCPEGWQCCHLDGNKGNNAPSNLRWATAKENTSHKRLHGTHQAGEAHPRARLNQEQVSDIRARHKRGESTYRIAPDFGLHPSYVAQICRRERWSNV